MNKYDYPIIEGLPLDLELGWSIQIQKNCAFYTIYEIVKDFNNKIVKIKVCIHEGLNYIREYMNSIEYKFTDKIKYKECGIFDE